jgi:succinoglycan biosynthesis protein ExoA
MGRTVTEGSVRIPPLPPLDADVAVSFILPARRAAGILEACLERILAQAADRDQIIVSAADTETGDIARAVGASVPSIRVVDNVDGTTPAALNRALDVAIHPVIIRIDAQSRIPPDYRTRLVELLRRTGAANVGGRQVAQASEGFAAAVAIAMNSPLGHGGASYRAGTSGGPVDTVYLGAFRREALIAVGGYDERFLTNQDAELNERLRRAGGTVWLDPTLAVGYLPRTRARDLARQFFNYGRGRAMTVRQHPGSMARRQLAAPLLVLGLLSTLALVPWSVVPFVLGGAGYGAGLAVGAILAGPQARRRLPQVMLATSVMHLAWGTGFVTANLRRRGGPPRGPQRRE